MIEKHNVFVSFYHKEDSEYKEYIDRHFKDEIINKSVKDGEYDSDNSDEYVKRLIREDKITSSSVVVVLIGPNTKNRKHVDWEIYAGLDKKVNGNSGLVGILLPTLSKNCKGEYYIDDLPLRLKDNYESGYAKCYTWENAINNFVNIVQEAFDNRVKYRDRIDNSRIQMKNNK